MSDPELQKIIDFQNKYGICCSECREHAEEVIANMVQLANILISDPTHHNVAYYMRLVDSFLAEFVVANVRAKLASLTRTDASLTDVSLATFIKAFEGNNADSN